MLKATSQRPPETIAALDIGTAKIACVIARIDEDGLPVLVGIGQQRSRGIKAGMVVEAEEAARAVKAAVHQAERMAGVRIGELRLAIACGRMQAVRFLARAAVELTTVRQTDLDRVMAGGEAFLTRAGRTLVTIAKADWQLDGATGVRDPRGLAGHELALDINAVTADEGPVRNLIAAVEQCHVSVAELIPAPLASAYAVTSAEERRAGCAVLDIGAGTTTLARFSDLRLDQVEAIPVGGNHVTYDIVKALVTAPAEAERLKTLYGTLVSAASDATELIAYPMTGGGEPVLFQTSKAKVREIIAPRMAILLDLISERIAAAAPLPPAGIIVTGGGSLLSGLDIDWSGRLGIPVRIGRPRPIGQMAASLCSPSLSTVLGLLGRESRPDLGSRSPRSPAGYIGRVHEWLRESF